MACSTALLARHTSELVDVLVVGLWLPHSNCWEEAWRYVMREVGDSVRSDERLGDASPVGLESESDGDGTEVGTYATPPVWFGPSDAGAGLEAAPGSSSSGESSAEGDSLRPRFNRYASGAVVEQMVSLRREGFTVNEIAERVGFHRTTVSKHLKRAGLKLRTDVSDESFQQRVRQVYAETGTIKGTAKKLGVSKGTVRKVLRATHHPCQTCSGTFTC